MSRRVIITVVITLLVGMGIGFFTAGQLARKRMDRERAFMENPRSEKGRMLKNMELNEEQKPKIEPILDEFLEQVREVKLKHRNEMDTLHAEFRRSVRPHLTEKQHNRLEKRRKRNKRRRGGRRR